ncbi:DNA helicase PcrA [Cutibacterium sp. V970]|uniref:DNA helicase PcrA n=1 Tax=Cutibacterium sp. V970 TaxID=3446481 RepID=UPI003EE28E77
MTEPDLSAFFASRPSQGSAGPGTLPADVARTGMGRAVDVHELLDHLNPPQREAVLHTGSPVLVVAGAGSGKTRVLTRRIAHLVTQRGVHPGSILAITFTNKAAAEMKGRVVDLVGNRARSMWVSTFHSSAVRILRSDADKLGLSRNFSIYDDTDAKRLISLVARDSNVDPKTFKPRAIMNWISHRKNELMGPSEAAQKAQTGNDELHVSLYAEYQRRLHGANALDFDDLIMKTVVLLRQFPEVREQYRRRFRHVLVDEYQDTNTAQYQMIRALCADESSRVEEGVALPGQRHVDPPELMVVGDSDQSIYAFRGATIRNILDFEKDFPGARTILLEQNYRSTQNILSAANSLIQKNTERPAKNLWTDQGEGAPITGYVADTEHDEASWIVGRIDELVDQGRTTYGEVAVFYRTNAQSRALEEVFIRTGLPYRVVGGVRFYERREVRDAVSYLRAIANKADDVSVRRILNVPKRGIGARAEAALELFATARRISFSEAIERVDEIDGLATRSANQIRAFGELMAQHRAMMERGGRADEITASILKESGYITELENSKDPQDETRLENLVELVSVAEEFVARAHTADVPDDETVVGEVDDLVLAGDDSLPAFLEQIALVADADQIPTEGDGVVTLMTLHTAKGLEFDTVFLTGFEDGLFPHEQSLADPAQLQEERRLAYVGITRARKQLFISRAVVRTMWGSPRYNPVSRFVEEIPDRLVDWERVVDSLGWQAQAQETTRTSRNRVLSSQRPGRSGPHGDEGHAIGSGNGSVRGLGTPELSLQPGDKVLHTTWGLGTVTATSGHGAGAKADVDFGSVGVKRLALRFAPIEKL